MQDSKRISQEGQGQAQPLSLIDIPRSARTRHQRDGQQVCEGAGGVSEEVWVGEHL